MRKIRELIWHCTATPEGREVFAGEIDRWHKDRGWAGIGYHKVVHLDGTVSEGRPESRVGAHVAGRNTGTIGYVYVGGLDRGMKPKDTRTVAQKRTMQRLTVEAIRKYGLTKVSGHRDYAAKACPCFDARREYAPLLEGGVKVRKAVTPKLPQTFEHDVGMPAQDPAVGQKRDDVAGTATGVTGIVGATAVLGEAAEKIEPLAPYSDKIMVVFVGLTIAGVVILIWSRVRKR